MQVDLLLWLPASGTLSDDSYAVTRSSITARCSHSHCVAASVALQACSVLQVLHLSECEICVTLIWVHVICLHIPCMCVWVDVLMRRCSLWASEPCCVFVSVVACVTLTISQSNQEGLSYAACFCLCCAGATSPQRVMASWIWSADGSRSSSARIFPGEPTAPCWQLNRPVKEILSLMCLRV